MTKKNPQNAGSLPLPTGAQLAAHRDTFTKVYDAAAVYGLPRNRLGHMISGKETITPTIGLIYYLATRYPEIIDRPVTIEEFLARLEQLGITKHKDIAWLIGKKYRIIARYREDVIPSPGISRLMTHLVQCLDHRPLAEIKALVADVWANPVAPSELLALKATWRVTDLLTLLGMESPHFIAVCQRERLLPPIGIHVRLLQRYPELAPPMLTPQAEEFRDLMFRHGVPSYGVISRLLGRVRQVFSNYISCDVKPSGPVMALMKLITRFLQQYPIGEYVELVEEFYGEKLPLHEVVGAHQLIKGAPKGWMLLIKPAFRMTPDAEAVVPDWAGWRRQRVLTLPQNPLFELAPDWVCENLSPFQTHKDRIFKLAFYAHCGVPNVWLIDKKTHTLEAFILSGGEYQPVAMIEDATTVHVTPFKEVAISMTEFWG